MIRLLSGSEKRLEIFKCKNNLLRSEHFCAAGDAEGSESISTTTAVAAGGLDLHMEVGSCSPHAEPKWFLGSCFLPGRHSWLPKAFAIKMESKQGGGSQGAKAAAVPAENQGGHLMCDQHPGVLGILQPAPRQRVLHQPPTSSLAASEVNLKSVCSGAC